MEDIDLIISEAGDSMKKSLQHLDKELLKIRAGRANPAMLEGVMVEYYGSMSPLSQVSNVSTPDARTLSVQPWEKALIPEIEKAIMNANLGFNPQNNGEVVIINIPPLTEDRRRELVKRAKAEGEEAKVSIRSARKDANDMLKDLDGISEDLVKDAEERVQALTNKNVTKVDSAIEVKEAEIMKV
ncbi:ribosome recycling factor [Croceimicrobium hydrocarbonivorans]|uniref:Ribosome-recycling factor n=1 Tax=Croceimicrobium hydrocarbonivorans TaxID=2761580 RepID=A0A7H0VAE6_9FLAO|nr:ribosome recycling factor [Croceimicrobium hydrocarbonivorans]QNR22694.1 ribosome recycling factor [Croceimicrobium hydrocarbonivorans]|tara:strand:+ start:3167 stop:3721 length:555 start_codon:yes stop_codon:yes gene_type:complete